MEPKAAHTADRPLNHGDPEFEKLPGIKTPLSHLLTVVIWPLLSVHCFWIFLEDNILYLHVPDGPQMATA